MKQLTKIALNVLSYFFENPKEETHLRELARKLGMNATTVMRAVNLLTEMELLLRRAEKHATYFRANSNQKFKEMKKAYTISKIFDAGIVELFKEKSVGLSAVLLYGSAAKGEDDRESDYDFLVIASKCGVTTNQISELLGRETSLQVYNAAGWKRVSKQNRAFYLEVISNSIPLHGEKPVID
jgi:predicted nucleotidyltransferase